METIDTEWESFLENDNIGYNKIDENHENNSDDVFLRNSLKEDNIPKCSEIYISTKTKISYLNVKEIDIKNICGVPVNQDQYRSYIHTRKLPDKKATIKNYEECKIWWRELTGEIIQND